MEGRSSLGPGPSFWGSLQRRGILPWRRAPSKQRPKALTVLILLAVVAYSLILLQQHSHDAGAVEGLGPREFSNNASRYTPAALTDNTVSIQKAEVVSSPSGVAAPPPATADPELEAELSQRRDKVWEACKAHGLVGEDGASKSEPNAWEFFIDDRHHVVWCNVFKAASSSWMYNFNLLGGYKEQYLRRSRKTPLSLARSRFPRPTVAQLRAALPHSLSFLIVRDPFERLLSAYRNKIEGFRHKFYRKMARDIITKFRPGSSPMSMPRGAFIEKSPTFSEFVSWVIASAREGATGSQGGSQGIAGFDEHWAPYFRFCTPCAVNFTVVAKMETLTRDEVYIIQRAGMASALGLNDKGGEWEKEWRKRSKPREAVNAAIGGKTEDVLPKYFKTLSRTQLDDLYDIYRVDFQMFGYDASKYFAMLTS